MAQFSLNISLRAIVLLPAVAHKAAYFISHRHFYLRHMLILFFSDNEAPVLTKLGTITVIHDPSQNGTFEEICIELLCAHIYTHTHTHPHTHTHTHSLTHSRAHTHVRARKQVLTHSHTHTHTNTPHIHNTLPYTYKL